MECVGDEGSIVSVARCGIIAHSEETTKTTKRCQYMYILCIYSVNGVFQDNSGDVLISHVPIRFLCALKLASSLLKASHKNV